MDRWFLASCGGLIPLLLTAIPLLSAGPGTAAPPAPSRARAVVPLLLPTGRSLPLDRMPALPALYPPVLTATASTTPACLPTWQILPSPNPGTGDSLLNGVAALAVNDIWAVGSDQASDWRTLVAHWDGQTWSSVPSPNAGLSSVLYAVNGPAPNDVWAVGNAASGAVFKTLVEHWDGTSWTIIPSPNGQFMTNRLNAVAARSRDDGWAVGLYENQGIYATLIEHWNGSTWSIIPSPNPGTYHFLTGVTALAPNNAWAVGWSSGNPNTLGPQPLILHWDGQQWSVVPAPNPEGNGHLNAITALTADNLWAAGYYGTPTGLMRPLIEHWDGHEWRIVASPGGPENNDLTAITASSASDIWATGYTVSAAGTNYRPLAAHWDGRTWSLGNPPSSGGHDHYLLGAAALGATMYTVGYYAPGTSGFYETLIERYTDPCRTPAPITTPTPCLLQFADVLPGSPFAPVVNCLACRGIVSGYPCGGVGEPCPDLYYRPGTPVTRGQLAKIVAEAADLADPVPPSQQTFEDVARDAPFHLWVERLAGRTVLGGYPCGASGEPCIGPTNRPYFRPNTPVTRGQLAQIIASTAGWAETPVTQTFEDSPPGSLFYRPIEQLARRGVIGGYRCGSPLEPCVPPSNRPYFRPTRPATRGQAAQMVATTFVPTCQLGARR